MVFSYLQQMRFKSLQSLTKARGKISLTEKPERKPGEEIRPGKQRFEVSRWKTKSPQSPRIQNLQFGLIRFKLQDGLKVSINEVKMSHQRVMNNTWLFCSDL